MQGLGAGGKNPIEEMGEDHTCLPKLERVHRKISKYKSADGDLDHTSEEWEAIFHARQDSQMVIDSHFRITRANRAASCFLDKPFEEIIGTTCWQTVHGTKEPPEECPLRRALSSGKHEKAELHMPEKDIWIEVSVDPIIVDQGHTSSAVHTIRDITERKKDSEALRKSEEKHRAIFEGAVDGIVYADRKARVIDVNPAFTRITGIPREEVVGKSAFHLARRFARPKDIPRLLKAVRLALSGKPVELYEIEINNKIVEKASKAALFSSSFTSGAKKS